jgi:hypothetical protein
LVTACHQLTAFIIQPPLALVPVLAVGLKVGFVAIKAQGDSPAARMRACSSGGISGNGIARSKVLWIKRLPIPWARKPTSSQQYGFSPCEQT